jgi:glycosyltransferase involved in cell wall biosynthesis
MLLGLTSFLRKEFKIKQPTFGIFTSPIYNLKELISNIGIFNLFKYRKYTFIHVVNSLIPDYLVKKYSGSFEKIVFLSNYSCQKLVDKGFPKEKSVIIPVGVDEHFKEDTDIEELKKFQRNINPENIPLIMYFTSPLTLRGTDTLIKAFGDIRKEKKSKLIFLSRVDHPELQKEEKILRQLAIKNNISDSVEIISDYLSQDVLKNYLSAADLICIPFKIVISDIPVSILEAMSIGKPVISTKVACLPELLPNGILVKANNPKNLADSLSRLVNDRNLSNNLGMNNKFLMEKYPSWDQIASNFKRII